MFPSLSENNVDIYKTRKFSKQTKVKWYFYTKK